MVELKSQAELDVMRESGRVVAQALQAVKKASAIGVSLKELDEVAAQVIRDAGAKPNFLNYRPHSAPTPFPGVICASVNDAVVHGIPSDYRLTDGDLVSIDCGAYIDGWHGDAAISYVVGTADPADLELIATTERGLAAGIAAAVAGGKMGDISHAVGSIGREAGYGLLENHGGHGIGRAMHEDPHLPNEGRPGRGMRLKPGLVLAIEPMYIMDGSDEYRTAEDGWTLHTASGCRAAHVEHTVAITTEGPRVLTML
ncbi:type I methionyl aminopeptidase [Amycolatopsis regifaucium]|uniref:Methionine aminopeptidase n=1 Tax=Amycolatopsis regifaucium TaxID=546365 RepID=A0A154MTY0_9PSEU|nr:type I methionyl aminopeptidase [Amycolatopsis regifaucium]KZB87731.1 methionine aminopeptidase [Amycolatopsis regifaucium]OKA05556.1 type I methionyl aminopeptidase [Amycolatopsis regifaucium]SFI14475.1 methionine aminopeptidase, type I [Amycolatopsis regifaucium]